jgi:hypothetical protein
LGGFWEALFLRREGGHAARRNQKELNRRERKDHKEETSQALLFEFFVFFAVKIFLELRDIAGVQYKELKILFLRHLHASMSAVGLAKAEALAKADALSAGNCGFGCGWPRCDLLRLKNPQARIWR